MALFCHSVFAGCPFLGRRHCGRCGERGSDATRARPVTGRFIFNDVIHRALSFFHNALSKDVNVFRDRVTAVLDPLHHQTKPGQEMAFILRYESESAALDAVERRSAYDDWQPVVASSVSRPVRGPARARGGRA